MSQANQRRMMTETRLSVYSRCRQCQRVQFSADRTEGRAYATVLCPCVICNVCIVAKRCVL